MTVTVTIEGNDKLTATFNEMEKEATKIAGQAVWAAALDIASESMREVPVRDGILRASQVVTRPEDSPRSEVVSVSISYGGAASAYAMVQHERTDFKHTVGKAKYLADPVARAASGGFQQKVGGLIAQWLAKFRG